MGIKPVKDHSSFFEHIGYEKYKDEQDELILKLPINQEILAEDGTIPSGVFTTMIDIIIGSTIGTVVSNSTTTVSLNVTFFDLTNKGPYTSFASIISSDGKTITGEAVVLNKSGTPVAKGTGTFKVLTSKS